MLALLVNHLHLLVQLPAFCGGLQLDLAVLNLLSMGHVPCRQRVMAWSFLYVVTVVLYCLVQFEMGKERMRIVLRVCVVDLELVHFQVHIE